MTSIRFASMFTGFGGFDLGALAAGCRHEWGIEFDSAIAQVANENLEGKVILGDVLAIDPQDLPPVDLLHASPPCPNFSIAAGKAETRPDIELAHQVAHFIKILRPSAFTLENVSLYRKSQSWQVVYQALSDLGYWIDMGLYNAHDFGVPQSRKRFIARAVRGKMLRELRGQNKGAGWYEAIADLIPSLPESAFAQWQLARLPEKYLSFLIAGGGNSNFAEAKAGKGVRLPHEPALTVMTHQRGGSSPRAFIAEGSNQNSEWVYPAREDHEPTFTVTASDSKKAIRAWIHGDKGKVVEMTPRALARFQSFPDSYQIPTDKKLACRGIGNAVPPIMAQRIVESLVN